MLKAEHIENAGVFRWHIATLAKLCLASQPIKAPDLISERPPRGGLSVCAVCCGALVAIGTSLHSRYRNFQVAIGQERTNKGVGVNQLGRH